MVSEVTTALDLEVFEEHDSHGPFRPTGEDRLVGRLDEHPFLPSDLDGEVEEEDEEEEEGGEARPGA
jgi:hypothetical protein